jgi:MerR family transcriptional regulator, thiopeptide resistance regulator
MESGSRSYTVHQLAGLAGISVRTLHHYDQIGLLTPTRRTAAGYRLYGWTELLRLQQILFYKELDFPLGEIKQILDRPEFDQLQALREHRRRMQRRAEQFEKLLSTIDKTIAKLTEDKMELTDAELYEGLTPEQAERYPREARELYGKEVVEASEARARKLSKSQWQAIRQEGDQVTRDLADLAERQPDDPQVQAAIARHYAWIEHFWTPTAEAYRGLGQLYTTNDEFRANYDRYRPGLADFMQAAINYYCDHNFGK